MQERSNPDAPHPDKRRPEPGVLVPPPQRAKPARKSVCCGVGDGSPCPHPPHPQPVISGSRPDARRTGGRAWGSAQPRTPHTVTRSTPPGRPRATPQRAKPARKSARCGVGDGSPRPHPAQPQPVVSGPRPHARRTGGRAWESVQTRTPQTVARGTPPGALLPPPQRAKPALKSAGCGVGDGSPRPHPPHPQPLGSGPRPHARRTGGRAWETFQTRTPQTIATGTPPGALVPPPQRGKPARKSTRCGVGDGSPRPQPPHPQLVESGPRPHARRTVGRAWGSAQPRMPHTVARGTPPPGTLVPAHSVQSELARACAVGLVTGPHSHTPCSHSQWVGSPSRTPEGRAVGRGRASNPGRPTPRQEAPPPGGSRAVATARKASSQERALWGS